jgi:hypothetical protein
VPGRKRRGKTEHDRKEKEEDEIRATESRGQNEWSQKERYETKERGCE